MLAGPFAREAIESTLARASVSDISRGFAGSSLNSRFDTEPFTRTHLPAPTSVHTAIPSQSLIFIAALLFSLLIFARVKLVTHNICIFVPILTIRSKSFLKNQKNDVFCG